MQIKMKNIQQLNEYENNPRNNEKAVDAVARSIKEFGFKVPIIITKEISLLLAIRGSKPVRN